ncbi:membrane protein [Rhodococcus aetherivorans]|uniref:Membrane protein n=1 Tax=Rhodococcus aetherivorans TaxID=191292 RepID=A0ABQ0YHE4_9NOCA|nr:MULTISPECIES: DsbA family protein [Rhodococcus]ETT27882.1 Protein-disulfide isomerase-like protein [Rhodococcus rhodochrous ATCC 21198]KDE09998.1 DSBA oxidoreductase [Rhodococcus aetherivorans]MDV6296887.1 DsbA family protein [Rhodococcus aetherivorans]NGP28409.1 DsbA family protein [Rhodococcus aetherivorans]OLL16115.1 disulfide bond formation protein DsbA [Rhodococcus sp. M8]
MKLTTNVKVGVALVALFVVLLTVLLYTNRSPAAEQGGAGASATPVWTEEIRTLTTAADDKVQLVEFLDFECESCRALYPVIERVRAEYAGRIDLGLRYFPIPSHTNSHLAARVVEAAARQGRLEPMYRRMYDTQAQWGESSRSQEAVFRQFAQELELDMARFDRDVNDPAVAARVDRDFDAGLALGVQGTPTLFLNGVELPAMPSYEELRARIDAALAQ